MSSENSGPLINIEERESGRVLAPEALQAQVSAIGTEIGQDAVATTKNLREAAVKEALGQLGLSHDAWKEILAENFKEVVENDGLSEDEVRENWAAKAEAFPMLAKHFGMSEVSPAMTPEDLQKSFVVAMSVGGTYYMVAPGVLYNVSHDKKGDGLFAMTYITGKKGGKQLTDGKRPDEVRAATPAHASRVLVYKNKIGKNEAAGKYEEYWEKSSQAPTPKDMLWIEHDKLQEGHHIETTPILKIYYLQDPQNVEAMMAAFDSAAVAINQETLADTEGVVGRRKLPTDPIIQPEPESAVEEA